MVLFTGKSKLQAPRLGRHLPRPRLFAQLDDAKDKTVLWIGGPAGSGKTTLINSYIAERNRASIWYKVDPADTENATVFHHLQFALKQFRIRLRPPLPIYSPEYQHGVPAFVRQFCRAFAENIKSDTLVVFDNYQNASASDTLDAIVRQLAEELPDGSQIVVISRSSVTPAFARLVLDTQLAELTWHDLRFTEDESAALLDMMNDNSANAKACSRRLHLLTQGWVSGLILALQWRDASSTAIQAIEQNDQADLAPTVPQRVFDYFASEVFANLDSTTQRLLCATALLPQITVAVAVTLSELSHASVILAKLERNQLFTTSSGLFKRTYEYHPLFRAFLLAQASEMFPVAELSALRARAAQCAVAENWYEDAAALFLEMRDSAGLAQLICASASHLVKAARYDTLRRWLSVFGEADIETDPWLCYWYATSILHTEPKNSYLWYERAFRRYEKTQDVRGLYLAWIGVAESLFFSHDDYTPALAWIELLHKLRERHFRYPSLEIYARVTFSVFNLMTFACPGHPQFRFWLRRAERLFRLLPDSSSRCMAGFSLARYYGLQANPARLAAIRNKLLPLAESDSTPAPARVLASWVQLWCSRTCAREDDLERALNRALALGQESGALEYELWIIAGAAYEYIGFGREAHARRLFEMVKERIRPDRRLETSHFHHLSGDLELLVAHNYDVAERHLTVACKLSFEIGLHYLTCLARTSLCQVFIVTGQLARAEEELSHTRELAREAQLSVCTYASDWVHAWFYFARGDDVTGTAFLTRVLEQIRFVGSELLPMHMASRQLLFYKALALGMERSLVVGLIRQQRLAPPPKLPPRPDWPHPIKLHLLGKVAILVDEKPLALSRDRRNQPLMLLKFLVASGGHRISQEKIFQALWPDSDGDAAAQSFHTTLHRLRKNLLGDKEAIIAQDGVVSLNSNRVWIDCWELEKQLDAFDSALAIGDRAASQQHSTTLRTLYSGPFLGAEAEPSWAIHFRTKLQTRVLRALTDIGRMCEQEGRYDDAIVNYQHAIEIDALAEPIYQYLMRVLVLSNRHAEALAVYQRCRKNVAQSLGVMPSAATVELYHRIVTNERELPRHLS